MSAEQNSNKYDLDERTFHFALTVCIYTKSLKRTEKKIFQQFY